MRGPAFPSEVGWRVFAAAVAGGSHIEHDIPCQDAFAHRVVGDVLVAAVCDGAGSAARSHVGARVLSQAIVEGLAVRVGRGLDPRSTDTDAMTEALGEVVLRAREALEACAVAELGALPDYAATLVAVLACAHGGWFLHIGDGVGVATRSPDDAPCVVSLPDNGEYANETYFVTGDAWRSRLRLTRFDGPLRHVVLMTDGTQSFAMDRTGQALFGAFFDPVEKFLAQSEQQVGEEALEATLADERTLSITGDDKTLLIALST